MNALEKGVPLPRRYDRIAVIGAGAYGTALATALARAGRRVRLYGRRNEVVSDINLNKRNSNYIGDVKLPGGIRAFTDIQPVVSEAEAILLVVPSGSLRQVARNMLPFVPGGVPVVTCSKGIELGTGCLMSEIVQEEMPGQPIAALSGPTFANEVIEEFPSTVTIASDFPNKNAPERSVAARLSASISSGSFRAYVSDDLIGVEVGGAMKNVIAIACGISKGAGFRANMTAAFITRGLAEMTQLATRLGGRPDTVAGLSGLGDLTLTCSSEQSRNLRFGIQLGTGVKPGETFEGEPVVVEGASNAISVTDLARKHGLYLPISEAVRAIVHENADMVKTISDLWARPIEAEPHELDVIFRHPNASEAREKIEELIG